MTNEEKIRLAISNNCPVSFSVANVPAQGREDLVTLALARGVSITIRDAIGLQPTELALLTTMANQSKGLLRVEF